MRGMKGNKAIRQKDVLVSRDPVYGDLICEAIVHGFREWHRYGGYTKREAVRHFCNLYNN